MFYGSGKVSKPVVLDLRSPKIVLTIFRGFVDMDITKVQEIG